MPYPSRGGLVLNRAKAGEVDQLSTTAVAAIVPLSSILVEGCEGFELHPA